MRQAVLQNKFALTEDGATIRTFLYFCKNYFGGFAPILKSSVLKCRREKSKYSTALSIQRKFPCPSGGGSRAYARKNNFFVPIFSALFQEHEAILIGGL